MLMQVIWLGHAIAEITCPTKYFEDASSINFTRSVKYGFGCLFTGLQYCLAKSGLYRPSLFKGLERNPG
jgi:hypothetical protein